MPNDTILAWHFVGDTLRDGRPIPADGVWLRHSGPIIPCQQGLHASIDPFDALQYAPGETLCLVEVRGDIQHHGNDKLAGRERCLLARMDFTEPLRFFARMQALKAVHRWDAPDVVLDYLMTGEETLRDVAWTSAAGAAWASAWASARASARDAARASARDAARASARDAARASARDAARASARASAWASARDAACQEFNALVRECFEGPLSVYEESRDAE